MATIGDSHTQTSSTRSFSPQWYNYRTFLFTNK